MSARIIHKPIPLKFTEYGFTYEQVFRNGDLAIYRQSKHGRSRFELVLITRHDGYTVSGMWIEPAETYPGPKQWGVRGWTLPTLDAAKAKLDKVMNSKW